MKILIKLKFIHLVVKRYCNLIYEPLVILINIKKIEFETETLQLEERYNPTVAQINEILFRKKDEELKFF